MVALNLYYYLIKKLHPEARFSGQCIQNIVSSANLGNSVRIDEMAKEVALSMIGHYEPEIFPGFRLAIRDPNMKALVFTGGKVVLTGGKNRADIARAWSAVCTALKKFVTCPGGGLPALQHAEIIQLKVSGRKRKVMD